MPFRISHSFHSFETAPRFISQIWRDSADSLMRYDMIWCDPESRMNPEPSQFSSKLSANPPDPGLVQAPSEALPSCRLLEPTPETQKRKSRLTTTIPTQRSNKTAYTTHHLLYTLLKSITKSKCHPGRRPAQHYKRSKCGKFAWDKWSQQSQHNLRELKPEEELPFVPHLHCFRCMTPSRNVCFCGLRPEITEANESIWIIKIIYLYDTFMIYLYDIPLWYLYDTFMIPLWYLYVWFLRSVRNGKRSSTSYHKASDDSALLKKIVNNDNKW